MDWYTEIGKPLIEIETAVGTLVALGALVVTIKKLVHAAIARSTGWRHSKECTVFYASLVSLAIMKTIHLIS